MKELYVAVHKIISKSLLCTEGSKPIRRSLKLQLKCERRVSSVGGRNVFEHDVYIGVCLILLVAEGESKL